MMRDRVVVRYSDSFKRAVVSDLESGRFSSVEAANEHHGIRGATTVKNWVIRLGQNQLLAKVVRVQKPDEPSLVSGLRREIAQLQKALGQTQARSLLNESYLELACERLGEEVEAFKKKSAGKRCIDPGRVRAAAKARGKKKGSG
jgi:transposase-like protein